MYRNQHDFFSDLVKNSVMSAVSKFMLFLLLLPESLQMPNMSTKRLSEGGLVVVPDAKLLARFTHNRSDLWIVNLTHTWEQVMSGLMVQGTWKENMKFMSMIY